MATSKRDPHHTHEPVGVSEIAERLGLRRNSVDVARHRGTMPDPRWHIGGRPAWCWACDIQPWAIKTGRL
jgi:hypothetical protein